MARETTWAEDLDLFLRQRVALGPAHTIFHPYDGYLHVVPRLLTDVAVLFPMRDYAVTVTGLSCLAVGAIAAAVYVFAADTIPSHAARIGVALVPVLTPNAAFEVLGNFANLHSFLLFLIPIALLFRPKTWLTGWLAAVVMLLATLTEVQAVVFAPVLLITARTRKSWPIGGAFIIGVSAQLLTTLVSARPRGPVAELFKDVVKGWFLEPVMSTIWPNASRAGALVDAHSIWFAVALSVPFITAAVFAALARRAGTSWHEPSRLLPAVLLVASPIVWVTDLLLNPTPFIDFTLHGADYIGQVGFLRYAVVPSMFLLTGVVLAADALLHTARTAAKTGGVIILIAVVALCAIRFEPVTVARSDGPLWATGYQDALHLCHEHNLQEAIPGAPTGWFLTLPCTLITHDTFS